MSDLERALIAYRRWNGFNAETEIQRSSAKAELDTLILRMDPEEWNGLRDHVGRLGEAHARKLMSYSLHRAMDDLQDLSREVRELPDWSRDEPQDEESEGSPSLSRKRRRDREP